MPLIQARESRRPKKKCKKNGNSEHNQNSHFYIARHNDISFYSDSLTISPFLTSFVDELMILSSLSSGALSSATK